MLFGPCGRVGVVLVWAAVAEWNGRVRRRRREEEWEVLLEWDLELVLGGRSWRRGGRRGG